MTYTAWSVIAGDTPTATKWNLLGGNDADFDTRIQQLLADETTHAFTDGATITLNMSIARLWDGVIAGNRTLDFSNVVTKRPFGVIIQQDGTGSRTITFPSGISWPGGSAPPLSTVGGQADAFVFVPKSSWVASSNEKYWGLFGGFGIA